MVTYGTVYVYARTDGETWAAAFAREPIALAEHGLTQAEGICFTMDGRGLLVTSEGHHAPLVRYTFGNPP